MFRRFVLLIGLFGACSVHSQAQMLDASQFPGPTVGDKISAAQTQGCISGMSCVITIPAGLSVWPEGTLPTRCGSCAWQDYRTAGQITLNTQAQVFSNAGVFTNTQMNEYLQSLINGCIPMKEYQRSQGVSRFGTDAVTGCNQAPAGGTASSNNGVAGYANTSSPTTIAVGVLSDGACLTNGTNCEGGNDVVIDCAAGFPAPCSGSALTSGILMVGREVDTQPQNASTAYNTVNGLLLNLFTPQSGTFANAFGSVCTAGQSGIWQVCYVSSDGKAATFALAGSVGVVANSNSQSINANIRDSGNVVRTLSMYGDSSGAWTFNSYNGRFILDKNGAQAGVFDLSGTTGIPTFTFPSTSGTVAIKGGNLQTARVAGCATAATAGSVCTTTVTWSSAFADTAYTATCSGDVVTSGVPSGGGFSAKAAASVTFRTVAVTAVAAQYTTIDCTAVHD
jgi:hypothetical protein